MPAPQPPHNPPSLRDHDLRSLTPLWVVYVFSFLNSLGTGVITNGIYFVTDQAYRFSSTQNFLLGVIMGLVYIVGALTAGPAIRGLSRLFPGLSNRGCLAIVMILCGACCVLPPIVCGLGPVQASSASKGVWAVWLMVAAYSALSGALWPMVESYLSGGRGGPLLRRSISNWNVVWASALIVAYLAAGPVIASGPGLVFLVLGAVHVLSIRLLWWFTHTPAEHVHESHEGTPEVYVRLLVTFRMLLPMAYVVCSAMGALLPSLVDATGVSERFALPVAAAWLIARVITFRLFAAWQGWHGRWFVAIMGGTALLAGFAITVLSPALLGANGSSLHIPALLGIITGLSIFGFGMATIYSAAIYYAMEVGQSEVNAGGTHEALIGLGYTIGPLCGLLAALAIQPSDPAGIARVHTVVLIAVSVIGLGTALAVFRRVFRNTARRTACRIPAAGTL